MFLIYLLQVNSEVRIEEIPIRPLVQCRNWRWCPAPPDWIPVRAGNSGVLTMLASDGWRRHETRLVFGLLSVGSVGSRGDTSVAICSSCALSSS